MRDVAACNREHEFPPLHQGTAEWTIQVAVSERGSKNGSMHDASERVLSFRVFWAK